MNKIICAFLCLNLFSTNPSFFEQQVEKTLGFMDLCNKRKVKDAHEYIAGLNTRFVQNDVSGFDEKDRKFNIEQAKNIMNEMKKYEDLLGDSRGRESLTKIASEFPKFKYELAVCMYFLCPDFTHYVHFTSIGFLYNELEKINDNILFALEYYLPLDSDSDDE